MIAFHCFFLSEAICLSFSASNVRPDLHFLLKPYCVFTAYT